MTASCQFGIDSLIYFRIAGSANRLSTGISKKPCKHMKMMNYRICLLSLLSKSSASLLAKQICTQDCRAQNLYLRSMQVHCNDVISPCHRQHICDKFRTNWSTRFVLNAKRFVLNANIHWKRSMRHEKIYNLTVRILHNHDRELLFHKHSSQTCNPSVVRLHYSDYGIIPSFR